MIDLRPWRPALVAVPLAVIVAMFSLQEVPEPKRPLIAPDAYDGEAAVTLARELAESSPNPRPGSDADESLASLVQARLAAVEGAQQAEQRFEADGRELRNLIAVLPGESDHQIALIAPRDVAAGSGAATSIASTAVLLEIASDLGGATHKKTLVFVSADGDSLGAAGTRRFIEDYTDADQIDAAVVISQPAAPEPRPPLVVPFSSGPQSTGIQLAETANAIVSDETGQPAGNETPLRDLLRLALPAGVGEQAPLIEAGVDAVRISSVGELPLEPSEDVSTDVSAASIDRFGRATLALMLALDGAATPLEHGPATYIGLAGNLLPGWALALVALSLLLPVAVCGALSVSASARHPQEAVQALGWTLRRTLPFLAGLFTLYLLDAVGIVPDPSFPFDPALEELGVGGRIGVVLALAAVAACFYALRPLRPPPPRASAAAAPMAVTVAAAAVFLVWLSNPYLALLLAVGLNLWLLAATGAIPGRLAAAALVVVGLIPLLLAVGDLAGRLDRGLGILPTLVLFVTGGQIGFALALLGCLLAGAGLAIIALAGPASARPAPQIRIVGARRAAPEREPGGGGGESPATSEPPRQPEESPQPDPSVYW